MPLGFRPAAHQADGRKPPVAIRTEGARWVGTLAARWQGRLPAGFRPMALTFYQAPQKNH
jgi:hypothetical protein